MACTKWHAVEVLLKASLSEKEQPLLTRWRDHYVWAFAPCYPRLHVITGESQVDNARRFFPQSIVPNVTVRANHLAPDIVYSKDPLKHTSSYYIMQWHAMWADNFTSAPWVLVFDVDSIPILPFRCHQLFDASNRAAHWYSWQWRHPAYWALRCTSVFFRARGLGVTYQKPLSTLTRMFKQKAEAVEAAFLSNYSHAHSQYGLERLTFPPIDLMTLFPIVIPRAVLPDTRRLVTLAMNATHFDAAFVALGLPSNADLIGKTALLLHPHLIHLSHCPASLPSRADKELAPDAEGWSNFTCRTVVTNTDHTRHPAQGSQNDNLGGYMTPKTAAYRIDTLLHHVKLFLNGSAETLPRHIFHYGHTKEKATRILSAEEMERASREAVRDDPPGMVCGVDVT